MKYHLRQWSLNDAENLVKHANNAAIAKFMTDGFPFPYPLEKAHTFINYANSHTPATIFAITVNDEAVGGIGIHPQTDIMCKNAELGYWLSEKFWGNGIATSAVKEIVEYAFKTFDLTRIYARPFGTNVGSQKVLQKAGFVLEATIDKCIFKNGEYLDELIYAIRR